METFISAYMKRTRRNHITIMEIARELIDKGCEVNCSNLKDERISFIDVWKDGKEATFGFEEVPYRWTMHHHIDPFNGSGSSRKIKVIHGTECEFTPDQIISLLHPFYKDYTYYENHIVHWMLQLTPEIIERSIEDMKEQLAKLKKG